jgi:hypothetical protein
MPGNMLPFLRPLSPYDWREGSEERKHGRMGPGEVGWRRRGQREESRKLNLRER